MDNAFRPRGSETLFNLYEGVAVKRILFLTLLAVSLFATTAFASSVGYIATDRFGYTGSVTKYDSLADLEAGTNSVASYAIGNRDLSIYNANDYNVFMGSWWYSTQGSAGYGNTRGNSGQGFIQMYDSADVTATTTDFSFGGFDGTNYTEFSYLVQGGGADYANAYSRFWIDPVYVGGGDKGIFLSYELALTATGLLGVKDAVTGWITAAGEPSDVTGYLRGIFQNTSTTVPEYNGYYVFDLALDMENWAYENLESLDPEPFMTSEFGELVPAPEPSTFLLLGVGLAGIIGLGRKRLAS